MGEALALLTRMVGVARIDRERIPATRLVRLCGGMPPALRIAAAKLVVRPDRPILDLVDELAGDDRLDSLAVAGDSRSVRTVFASAYRALSAPAAPTFRLLGLHPGPSFYVHLAAAACGVPLAEARPWVDELSATHLIVEFGDGRYRFHDLIGLFARQCGLRDESPSDQTEAATRMVDWYLILGGGRQRGAGPLSQPGTAVPRPRAAPAHRW